MVTTAATGRAGSCAAHAFGLPTCWAAVARACVIISALSVLMWPTWSHAQAASSTDEMAVLKENPGASEASDTKAAPANIQPAIASPSASLGSAGGEEDEGEGSTWMVMLVGLVFLVVIVLTVVVMIYARRGTSGHTSLTMRGDEDGHSEDQSRRPEALLIDKAGATELGEIAINEDVVILGRSKQNSSAGVQGVVLPVGTVGRRHACIEYRSHAFYVSDLASVNGTLVNGNRVQEPTILHNGDIVRIESLELTFSLPMEGQGEETQFVPERGVDDAMANMQATMAVPAEPTPTPTPAAAKPGSMIAQLSAEVEVAEAPEESTEVFAEPLIDVDPGSASITVAPGFEAAVEAVASKPPSQQPQADDSSVQEAEVDKAGAEEARDEDPDITLTEPMEDESAAPSVPAERITPPKTASDTHDSLIASLLGDDEDDEDRTAGDAVTGAVPASALPSPTSDAPAAVAPVSDASVAESSAGLPPPPEFAPSSDAPTAMPMAPIAPMSPAPAPDLAASSRAATDEVASVDEQEAPTSAFPDQVSEVGSPTGDTDFPLMVDAADPTPPVGDARAFAETTVGEEDTQDPHEADTADSLPNPLAPGAASVDVPKDRVDDLIREVEQSVPTPVLDPGIAPVGNAEQRADLEREGVVAPSNLPPVMPPVAPEPSPIPEARPQSPAPSAPAPRPAPGSGQMPPAFLVDLDGTTKEQQYQLESDSVVVGRSKSTPENAKTYLSIRRNTVGRKHATVRYARGLFWVEDHKSVNGTFVNGDRVDGMSPLVSGDEVTFDTYRFSFVVMDEDDASASLDPLDLDKTQFRGA